MCLYYLVANEQGFEEPLRIGTEAELLSERAGLKKRRLCLPPPVRGTDGELRRSIWCREHEWDSEHCPLIPVDLS